MTSYDKTTLWGKALAAKPDDPHSKERERLRAAYENVRKRAQPLAEAIARDLPDYTVHDITHADALWDYAGLIAGSNTDLTPCEAFVLGCAFLVHDLGMGLAAYPEGLSGLRKLDLWKDIVADVLRKKGLEKVNDEAIKQASGDVEKEATAQALRKLHAQRADKLALVNWTSPAGDEQFYLIEDSELRAAFGPIIGRIACSHWWSVDQLGKEFSTVMGAQFGFPQAWTVDPLKLACILRCADYAHIDEGRAPAFLRALIKPQGDSDDHWKFQAKLYQPRLEGDRLVFTAKSSFGIVDAGAWWLCFDALNTIDSELRKVDSLLADTNRQRFAARGVSQAEAPSRMATLIKTDGWRPVDTRIRVSAVASLISRLGGKELYGDTVTPPLRELIQNAADAVRARRLIDGHPAENGEIRVTSGNDGAGPWLQIEDTGVGMSEAVLTGPLLDFGTTFWGSTLMRDQFPGLAAKGFKATGRYGIGFFSVFMWGERVEVATQRFDKGRADTLVLSFRKGPRERPLLRPANPDEYIPGGGTRVKVWLSDERILERLRSPHHDDHHKITLAQVCARVAPSLDVTLRAEGDLALEIAVAENDWLSIGQEHLLKRISPLSPRQINKPLSYFDLAHCPPLRILENAEGHPLGRAAIWGWGGLHSPRYSEGVVTVGGLRASGLAGIVGILEGASRRASRDSGVPLVPVPVLREWAERERDARRSEGLPVESLASIAEVVSALGSEPIGLPIAKTSSGWVTPEQVQELAKSIDEALLADNATVHLAGGEVADVQLNSGAFSVSMGRISLVVSLGLSHEYSEWPPIEKQDKDWGAHQFYSRTLVDAVIRALARGWACPLAEVVAKSSFHSDEKRVRREIGTLAGKSYVGNVIIIRNPAKDS